MKSPTLCDRRPASIAHACALTLFLSGSLPYSTAVAQSSTGAALGAGPASLPQVQVTGSRISRAQAEGPAAVTVLKSEDITRLGFKSVGDALASLTENTGFTQGEDFGNTFTPAANAISLRGLGPTTR